MSTERGRIINQGMGGFLNPPGHPEHSYGVETDLRRRPENRGGLSLSSARDADWLDPRTRAEAGRMLDAWQEQRPALDAPEVKDWIHRVLGYFRGCYRGPGEEPKCWNADTLNIDPKRDPMAAADQHAGVHLIRSYYPEYQPTPADFAEAYWGQKPAAQ